MEEIETVISEEAVEAFKKAWEEADRQELVGQRSLHGLRAAAPIIVRDNSEEFL